MGAESEKRVNNRLANSADYLINWSRQYSLWPMFFGLSCCFVEEATVLTARYDLARFGAEVLRPSPRQADLLITSGTIFKKIAPVVLRLYEQMAEPKWVISMGSCSNCGGMYDGYSVVQGIDQILPVDIYIPGCPPRPEAVEQGLVLLQQKIMAEERPTRSIFHLAGGTQGTTSPILVDGQTKSRDPRGPGMAGTAIRGTSVVPPEFQGSRSDLMWTPPPRRIELGDSEKNLADELQTKFGDAVRQEPETADMLSLQVDQNRIKDVLHHLKNTAKPRFRRLEDLTAIDESARRNRPQEHDYTLVYHLLSFDAASRLRLKVPLQGSEPVIDSITDIWPSASWYEREVFDMFGVRFAGHPNLKRLLMPEHWTGHPLRKNHPGRATELPPYTLDDARKLQPLDGGEYFKEDGESQHLILNIGPHHVSTHGLLRYIVTLDGEEITGSGHGHRLSSPLGGKNR